MRRALIVGINDYVGTPLEGCVNDANRMADRLGTNGNGSPNFHVPRDPTLRGLMTSPTEEITRATLREAIDRLFATECDVALLYFAGHGYIRSAEGFLVTTDAKKYDEGVSMTEILNWANESKVKNKVILLDCCHSGSMGTPNIKERGVASLAKGLTVLTSSRDSEKSVERGGAGVFTDLIIDALDGGAADLGGHVTPGTLYSYVDRALGAYDQRPIFKSNVSQFVSLREVKPPISPETLRKVAVYFGGPKAPFRLDPSYEFTEAGANPDNVAIFKDLQKMAGVGLVVPVDAEHMYFAAMSSKSCRLTALGAQYWRLAKENKL